MLRDVEVACSNHVTPIIPHKMGDFSILEVKKSGWFWLGLSHLHE